MKAKLFILALFYIFLAIGCTTEFNLATQKEEMFMYSTEREVKIGESIAAKMDERFDILRDVEINQRVEKMLDDIVAVCDRKDIVYFIKVIDDEDTINAVSLPGGYIYLFKGLIDHATRDDQIAGVIAHEVAHITARHGIKRLQASYGAMLATIAAATQTNSEFTQGVNIALTSLFTEHSQRDEFESDRLAVKYMKAAGYDPQGMSEFLEILREEQAKDKPRPFSYWRTHPHIPERIAMIHQAITGELRFKDYLNLLGRDE